MDLLADRTVEILIQEPNLLEVNSPQYLVGDVHGQFYDFLKMIKEVSTLALTQFHLKAITFFLEITLIEGITP